jgi:FAD:protein FMN transferase
MTLIHVAPNLNPAGHPPASLVKTSEGYWKATFTAMASPCEILVDGGDLPPDLLAQAIALAATETWRIEHKFSRYTPNNIVHTINQAQGRETPIDPETHQLLAFADTCYQLSEGLFDITSGILRRCWRFDGGTTVPSQEHINQLLPRVGWNKCSLTPTHFIAPADTEIDLGGIGKEYAADRSLFLLNHFMAQKKIQAPAFLINYGGDIAAAGERPKQDGWEVGLNTSKGLKRIKLTQGGLATSGDTHRFVLHQGQRLSHILNPKTGWPIQGAPSTVTVMADNCTQAGMLATLAMLKGAKSREFLDSENVVFMIEESP